MSNDGQRDLARQAATVAGALFQILAGAIVPIGAIAKETPSLVIPRHSTCVFTSINALNTLASSYSPECVEEAFSELPLYRESGSSS